MSIMKDIQYTMENTSGLSEMIDAAVDMFDPDGSYNDLDEQVYGALDTEDQEEIDDDVGEDEDADVDDFLEKDELDGPPEIMSDAKPLISDDFGGVQIPSDKSGEIDPDVGEECEADIDDCLESLMVLLEGDEGDFEEFDDNDAYVGTDILTGNCDDEFDECDDLQDDDEDLENEDDIDL